MTGATFELANDSTRIQDVSSDRREAQLSSGALALLTEGQGQTNRADARASSVLPEISFVGSSTAAAAKPRSDNPNMALGNPSNATANPSNADNFLIVRDQYAMSYNKDHKTPNWVSWQLDSDWIGSSGRSGPFVPDSSLPAGFDRATPQEYTNSGYDRGHNTPSGDRTKTHDDNEATFIMSNVAPQTADNNRGPWEKLESYSRQLAGEGKELYIIAGNEGSKGTIGNGINVPEAWWKVVVVLPEKGMTAADVSKATEVIAVEMPNIDGIRKDDWRKYTTTVGDIEKHTGYHLLSNLPPDVAKALTDKASSKGN